MLLFRNTRLVMSEWGQIEHLLYSPETGSSSAIWAEPRDRCSVYDPCGAFGACHSTNNLPCKCLPGFGPASPDSWRAGDYSVGCVRKTNNECHRTEEFLDLRMMKVGNPDSEFKAGSETECRVECLNNCHCQAYLYDDADVAMDRGGVPACWIWSEELNNLQEEYEGGRSLHVRVALTDIS